MRRRDFIKVIANSAAAIPFAANAEQTERVRRIGVLMNLAADDRGDLAAFQQSLQQLGWTVGRNVQMDIRWGAGNADLYRKYTAELIALTPDVLLTGGAPIRTVKQATGTIPIVFVNFPDPVAQGVVASLSRPGGNVTGFAQAEHGTSAKWLQLLKDIAPSVARVALLRDPTVGSGIGQFAIIQSVAPSFGVELSPIDIRDPTEIDRAVTAFARSPNSGVIVLTSASATIHSKLIIALAARHRLPAVYPLRYFVTGGGLISYGADNIDQFRRAAGYVDRILKGEKPANLPVQAPTKFELVINLKTAKALGLTVPPTLLATATDLIE